MTDIEAKRAQARREAFWIGGLIAVLVIGLIVIQWVAVS